MLVAIYVPATDRVVEVNARVARTPSERAAGFSSRTSLGPNEAIWFAFPTDVDVPFTMVDTHTPLDMAFFDAAGVPVWLTSARANDPAPYQPPRRYRYCLEVPAGWLARHGVDSRARVAWQPGAIGTVV